MSIPRFAAFGWYWAGSAPSHDVSAARGAAMLDGPLAHDELHLAVGAKALHKLATHPQLLDEMGKRGSLLRAEIARALAVGEIVYDATLTTTAELRTESGVVCFIDGVVE